MSLQPVVQIRLLPVTRALSKHFWNMVSAVTVKYVVWGCGWVTTNPLKFRHLELSVCKTSVGSTDLPLKRLRLASGRYMDRAVIFKPFRKQVYPMLSLTALSSSMWSWRFKGTRGVDVVMLLLHTRAGNKYTWIGRVIIADQVFHKNHEYMSCLVDA
jgi:hypothetical protein